MTKAADIIAAAPQTIVRGCLGTAPPYHSSCSPRCHQFDARAIVTAVNLFPLYEAVREAAEEYADWFPSEICKDWRLDLVREDHRALRAALDALQAAEDAL